MLAEEVEGDDVWADGPASSTDRRVLTPAHRKTNIDNNVWCWPAGQSPVAIGE